MSIIDDYSAIQKRRLEIGGETWPSAPSIAPARVIMGLTVAEFVAQLRQLQKELSDPAVEAHVEGKLREGLRDWSSIVQEKRDAEVLRQMVGPSAMTTNAVERPPAPIWRGFNLNVP